MPERNTDDLKQELMSAPDLTQFIKDKPSVYFLATEEREEQNRRSFKDLVAAFTKNELLAEVDIRQWESLFKLLAEKAVNQKLVIVIDEFQYLGKTNPAFPSVFQKIWDTILKDYLAEESKYRQCDIDAPLFCNKSKTPLTRGGVYYIIQKYVSLAQKKKPDLFPVRVHPHVFRHSRAMHWLEAGVDLQYIKDLLGHSDIKTTEVYARLNIKMKQKLLEQVHPQQLSDRQPSWTDDENLMQWLTQLYIPTK